MAITLNSAAVSAFERGHFAEAERTWLEIGAIHEKMGNRAWLARNSLFLAALAFPQGNFDEIRTLGADVLTFCRGGQIVRNLSPGHDCEYRRRLYPGPTALRNCRGQLGIWYRAGGCCLWPGRLLTRQQQLQSWLDLRIPEHHATVILQGLPFTALMLAQGGNLEQAAEVLGLAFQHPASLTGWLEKWPLLTRFRAELAGDLGAETFAAAWERGKHRELKDVITALIEQFQAEKAEPQPATSHAANRLLVAPLSERELEVLRLVAEGLSNPEIAQTLFLSPGTVKVHIRHIYDKLDVNSRVQAAARAKILHLL